MYNLTNSVHPSPIRNPEFITRVRPFDYSPNLVRLLSGGKGVTLADRRCNKQFPRVQHTPEHESQYPNSSSSSGQQFPFVRLLEAVPSSKKFHHDRPLTKEWSSWCVCGLAYFLYKGKEWIRLMYIICIPSISISSPISTATGTIKKDQKESTVHQKLKKDKEEKSRIETRQQSKKTKRYGKISKSSVAGQEQYEDIYICQPSTSTSEQEIRFGTPTRNKILVTQGLERCDDKFQSEDCPR
ncbi:hypothetical protein JTB14_036492 [Gonioctena quinquepunctata]|nr:hypothetical protein JTB14_036492 [Gonioctena quinquepunctata]